MAAEDVESQPTETSPLLGAANGNGNAKSVTAGTVNEIVPDSAVQVEGGAALDRVVTADSAREAQYKGDAAIKKQLKYIVPAVGVGVFLSAADQTIIVSSYGRIGSDLDALNLTSWIATSYFLTLTSFQPLYGKLSDIFGRKPCLLFSYLVFGSGCLFCGLAQDIYQLIAARVWQGIGGGGMTTVVSILMSDIVPLQERGLWQGIINIIFAAGAGLGAPLGGVFSDSIGWRWAFMGQAPLCLVAFLAVAFFLRVPAREQKDWRTNLKRIDFLGAAMLVVAVLGMLVGFDRGSNVAWNIPISYGPLAASVVFFGLFLMVEIKIAAEPFAPGHIIFDRSLFAGYMCNFFSFGGYMAVIYFLPLFYQAKDGLTATNASILLIPGIIFGVLGSLFGGIAMKRTGKYYRLNAIGYAMLPVGVLVIFLFCGPIVNSTVGIVLGQMIAGFGNGIGVTTSLIALISNAAPADQAVTTACSYLFRTLGSVIGLSATSTLTQQLLRGKLRSRLNGNKDIDTIVDGVRKSLDFVKELGPETRVLVRNSYGEAITDGFALTLGIVFFATLASVFIREKKLSR